MEAFKTWVKNHLAQIGIVIVVVIVLLVAIKAVT